MIDRHWIATPSNDARPCSLFDTLPRSSARTLDQWLDALTELSLDEWLAVARTDDVVRIACQDRNAAQRAALVAIADHQLELVAWFIRDMVASAAYAATRNAAYASARTRHELAAARAAAEWAALAIATASWLLPVHREVLCAPLRHVGPCPATRRSRSRSRLQMGRFVGDQPSRLPERED